MQRSKDNALFFLLFSLDDHECELSFSGESGLLEKKKACKKYPGHPYPTFISLPTFKIENFPPAYQDKDLYELTRTTAALTVRISTSVVSQDRPDCYPQTGHPYPYNEIKGSNITHVGTGRVARIDIADKHQGKEVCHCSTCEGCSTPNTVKGKVIIHTARHVIYDDIEAAKTDMNLWYDHDGSACVKLKGLRLMEKDSTYDLCKVVCHVCDTELLKRLDNLVKSWTDLCRKVRDKFRNSSSTDRLTVIVSHPHGCYKQVTIGYWSEARELEDARTKYFYDTATCPGSSGAFVFTLGREMAWFNEHVHSGILKGRNMSGAGLDF